VDGDLRLIKGGGGALLREKIVASASRRMIVVADGSKHVAKLGRYPLPIEVVPFGLTAVERSIARLLDSLGAGGSMALRRAADGAPYVTDGGHFILDAHLGRIDKPNVLASTLNNIPGVVEHGLFIGLATGAILATGEGLVELGQIRP
jgi:ribose 5-phosphate isomerase A